MEIRCIFPSDDRMAISKIYEDSWKHAYSGIIPQDFLDSIPKGRWAEVIDSKGWNTQIVLEDGRIVGTLSYGKSRFSDLEQYGEIYSIYILPEYTGKGIGKALLNSAIKGLSEAGYKDVFLWVLEENELARRFYEKMGFVCDGAYLEDNIGGKDLREIRYVFRI